MIRSISPATTRAHYRLEYILRLMPLLLLLACAPPLSVVHSSDLMGLDNDQLHQIQFYSGPIKIVFAAQTDEVIKQIQRDALITTNQQTGHRLTIPKETPGALVRMDYISRELLVRFDPDFPPLVYQDLGLGLELITTEVESEGLTYKRVLESPRGPRGRLKAQDRRLLTVRKKEKTESKLERKKVSGIKTSP